MRSRSPLVLLFALLVSALVACSGAPRSRAEGMEEMRKKQIEYFTEQIEANPNDFSPLEQRSQRYRDGGDEESLRKAVADLDRALRLAPKEKRALVFNARANTKGALYNRTKKEADKKSALDDLTSLIAAEPSSSSYMARANVLMLVDEPFLAEEDALMAIQRAGFEERWAWREVALYDTLSAVYGRCVQRLKGKPEFEAYEKLFIRSLDQLQNAKRNKRVYDEAVQRERMRANEAMLAELAKRDAARVADREAADAAYRAAQKKLWANRTPCSACGGRGTQSAGGGTEHRIDWLEGPGGRSIMRSTTKTTPALVYPCTECWGKGYIERD